MDDILAISYEILAKFAGIVASQKTAAELSPVGVCRVN